MNIPRWAVGRPVTTFMVFLGVVVLGVVSLSRLSVDLFPEIDFPAISVVTTYEGVGPEEMETLITRPVEQAVSRVQGVERIDSFSAEGRSRVRLRFSWGTSLDSAFNDVRAAIERIRDHLPEEAATPVVFKFDLSSFPIMFLTLSGNMESWQLRRLAEDVLKHRIERVEGVAAADVRGGLRREIHIDLNSRRLSSMKLTAATVAEALKRDNVNLPGGEVRERGREVIVRTMGEFRNLEQIRNVVVTVRDRLPIRVRDLGTVRDSYEKPINAVFIDGKPGIRLSVSKLAGANTVEVAARVRREVERINKEMPNIRLKARFDTSDYIQQSISNVERGVLYGAGLAVLVLLLFLRSFKATSVVAVAIPIAVMGTFAFMYLSGFTLNMISFGGIALGMGMLVDNSIVILENIQRHREKGRPPKEAAVEGSAEVSTAIVASTATTLSIFVPVVFIGGFAGIFFRQMALVVSFALFCSLAVALTLVPVLASLGRKSADASKKKEPAVAAVLGRGLTALERGYSAFLRVALSWRKTVFLVAVLLLAGSIYMFRFVGSELMPQGDESYIRMWAELPVGTPLEHTEKVIHEAEEIIKKTTPETDTLMTVAGPPGFWSSSGSNMASFRLQLVETKKRKRSAWRIAGLLRRRLSLIPGFRPRIRVGGGLWIFRMMRGGGERLSVEIRGFDLKVASRLAKQVSAALKATPGVTDTEINLKEGNREAQIEIDPDKAADLGLTVGEIGNTVSTYVLGKAATYYRDKGDEYTILVRLREADRYFASQLNTLPLITSRGDRISLGDVAKIKRAEGPLTIRRRNQERIVTVSAGFADRDLGSVVADAEQHLNAIKVPEGFTLSFGGEFEEQQKTFGQLVVGLVLALLLVYMVMASLFESLLHPFVMIFSIPFAFIGVVLTLLVTGTTLNVNSFLGIIVLGGVVVNNAIVLVDYVNLLRRTRGFELTEAVVEAGRRRLRPILMTTLTTALALLPVAIGVGEGSEVQAPLARVVVGGLLTSMVITLVFIPALYVSLERLRRKKA